MPTSYGHNTSVQLSIADLGKVITKNPQTRQCPESTSSIAKTEQQFTQASIDGTLAEESLCGDNGRHLQYIGPHQELPIFIVRVGKSFFDPNVMIRRFARSAKTLKQQTTETIAVYAVAEVGYGEGK